MLLILLAIFKHKFFGSHHWPVQWFICKTFLYEAIKLLDDLISSFWSNIVFCELITDHSVPSFTTDEFFVDAVISNDVHIIPPSVVKIMVPLLVHFHVDQAVHWQVECICCGDHLSVKHETKVRSGHGIVMSIVFVINQNDSSCPFILGEVLFDSCFSFTSSMNTKNSDEIVLQWQRLWWEGCWCWILK